MKKRGFTIVELMVVLGIICLLISIIIPTLNKAQHQNRYTPNPMETSPNVWIFSEPTNGFGNDNISSDLAKFQANHPDIELDGPPSGIEFNAHGVPQKYMVHVKPKQIPTKIER